MPPPVRMSAGVEGSVAHYYIAPPDAPVNLATAGMAGFLHVRAPYAKAMWETRLAAMDPAGQAAALAAFDEQAANVVESTRKKEGDVLKFASDTAGQNVQLAVAQENHLSAVDVANVNASASKYEADAKFKEAMSKLADVDGVAAGKMQGFRDGAARDSVKIGQVMDEMAKLDPASIEYKSRAATIQGLRQNIIRNRIDALVIGRDAGLNPPQLAATTAAMVGDTTAAGINDMTLDTLFQRRVDDLKLKTTWSAPELTGGVGGRAHLGPSSVGGGGGSVSLTTGTSTESTGTSPLPGTGDGAGLGLGAFAEQSGRVLDSIDADKARLAEMYRQTYGGFNDPIPGMWGTRGYDPSARKAAPAPERPTPEAMAQQVTAKMAEKRGIATPPAAADEARKDAQTAFINQTMSERVANDLDTANNVIADVYPSDLQNVDRATEAAIARDATGRAAQFHRAQNVVFSGR